MSPAVLLVIVVVWVVPIVVEAPAPPKESSSPTFTIARIGGFSYVAAVGEV
jgi:hypothetical protein